MSNVTHSVCKQFNSISELDGSKNAIDRLSVWSGRWMARVSGNGIVRSSKYLDSSELVQKQRRKRTELAT